MIKILENNKKWSFFDMCVAIAIYLSLMLAVLAPLIAGVDKHNNLTGIFSFMPKLEKK